MTRPLKVAAGHTTDKGRKQVNQDYHGVCVPAESQPNSKGVVVALADGISSSDLSQEASQSTVRAFLADDYCTSDA